MLKFLIILICLVIKTHSWTWSDYPSPRGPDYSKCRVSHPTYVCDPDGMLTDQQRKEIVDLVEDFKEKTRRPKSRLLCMREGLKLVVALAKVKIGYEDSSTGYTHLCTNDRRWTLSDGNECKSDVHGIELNTDGFRHCYKTRWLMTLQKDEYDKLNKSEVKMNDQN
ncbi:unnamed protein product [Meloidogyne enterolobii]|uniref:Uncharacterized protein n=1 Tax=Meloidogyne enterolobii TaxID=390850 RepID=A0ACB1A0H0_MELEN